MLFDADIAAEPDDEPDDDVHTVGGMSKALMGLQYAVLWSPAAAVLAGKS